LLLLELGARATPSLMRDENEVRLPALADALRLYTRSGLVKQHVPGDTLTAEGRERAAVYTGSDVIFTVPESKRLRLDLAKNHIIHWLVDRAMLSVALLTQVAASQPLQPQLLDTQPADEGAATPASVPIDVVRHRVQSLSRLFKFEFMYRADASFDAIFEELLAGMCDSGELARESNRIGPGPGRDGLDGAGWLEFHAAVLRNFLEAYRIAAISARTLVKGPAEEKELVARGLRIGERMFLEGKIERSEAVSRPTLANAFGAFVDQGYLLRHQQLLQLSETFASEDAARTIEARVAAFLPSSAR
jgi:glycerol-3-phosphate O-acyltransferase